MPQDGITHEGEQPTAAAKVKCTCPIAIACSSELRCPNEQRLVSPRGCQRSSQDMDGPGRPAMACSDRARLEVSAMSVQTLTGEPVRLKLVDGALRLTCIVNVGLEQHRIKCRSIQ